MPYERNNVIRNFDIIDFPKEPDTKYLKDIRKRKGNFSGSITLKMTAADNIYLGSGFVDFIPESKKMVGTTLEELGCAVIPGSSVKGAVRQVARAISDGCIKQSERKLILPKKENVSCVSKKDEFHVCIVCDLFGTMGLKSKLSFSDFTADSYETVTCVVPCQYSPKIMSPFYREDDTKDACHRGYKFYFTNCEKRTSGKKENITAVKKGTVFTGRIDFEQLDEMQMCLFMHSLGIGGQYFSHKIGGYKADGFGTVNFECTGFELNGQPEPAEAAVKFAKDYVDKCSDDCYYRIELLRDFMEYKK